MAIVKRIYKSRISFLARVRDANGKFYPSRNCATESEARTHEAELLERRKRGARSISTDARVTTYAEYWSVWSADGVRKASAGWKISQDQMNRDYIMPFLGNMYLADIDSP